MGTVMGWLVQIPRPEFGLVLLGFLALYGGMLLYFFLFKDQVSWKSIFWSGLVLRLIAFMVEPQWSDDYARFLWDGELLRINENPYAETPRQWIENPENEENDFLDQLFPKLNSPDYFSVYPPINQALFWIGAADSSGQIGKGVFALRLVLFLGEIGVFLLLMSLLRYFQKPLSWSIFYWLNPLIIIEIVGNIHFEGLVFLLLLAAIKALKNENLGGAGVFFGLSVGVKVLPLILIPAWISFSKTRFSKKFWLGFGIALLFGFFWLLIGDSLGHFYQSIRLYQGKFEFNASVYYVLRELGYWIQGYNTIAILTKLLSGFTLLSILVVCWKRRAESVLGLIDLWIGCYLIYLVFQPIVHPWYLVPGIGLSVISGRLTFVFWSFGAIFSYQAYSHPETWENPVFLLLEYGLVIFGLYLDYFQKKRSTNFGA